MKQAYIKHGKQIVYTSKIVAKAESELIFNLKTK